jgi:hypothetical protein
LGGMAEVRDDLVDAFFHPVEVFKGRIAADHLVGEDSRQPGVGRGVEQFRFADGQQQTLGGGSVGAAILFAQLEVLLQREFFLACGLETLLEVAKILMTSPRSIRGADAGSVSRCWHATGWPLLLPQNTLKRYR